MCLDAHLRGSSSVLPLRRPPRDLILFLTKASVYLHLHVDQPWLQMRGCAGHASSAPCWFPWSDAGWAVFKGRWEEQRRVCDVYLESLRSLKAGDLSYISFLALVEDRARQLQSRDEQEAVRGAQEGHSRRPAWPRLPDAPAGACHQAVPCVTQKAISPSGTSDSSLTGFFLLSHQLLCTHQPRGLCISKQPCTPLRQRSTCWSECLGHCRCSEMFYDRSQDVHLAEASLSARLRLGKGAEAGGEGCQEATHPCTPQGSSGT